MPESTSSSAWSFTKCREVPDATSCMSIQTRQTSWQKPEVVAFASQSDVETAVCDMCACGMKVRDGEGEAYARKSTRLMSNAPEVLKRLRRTCSNRDVLDTQHRLPSQYRELPNQRQLLTESAAPSVSALMSLRAKLQGFQSEGELRGIDMPT